MHSITEHHHNVAVFFLLGGLGAQLARCPLKTPSCPIISKSASELGIVRVAITTPSLACAVDAWPCLAVPLPSLTC